MRMFVSGGSGFLGSAICDHLYQNGHEIFATGCKTEQPTKAHHFLNLHLNGINWAKLKEIDVVFHLGANNDTLDFNKEEMFRANYDASVELFQKMYLQGCKQFVFASSCSVYGNSPAPFTENSTLKPLNPYAESKKQFEIFARSFAANYNVNIVCLRYSNVYGPNEGHKGKRASMIFQIMEKIIQGKRPKIFKFGEQKRDWIHVEDVVRANIIASKYKGFDIFNCGYGESYSFNDITKIVNKELKTNIEPEYIDNPNPDVYQNYTECNMFKSAEKLAFRPDIGIEEGVIKTINAYLTSVK